MFEQDPRITSIAEGENGLFCLYWSHLMEADKYSVSQKIPSVSGVYELYYEDNEKKLNLLTVAPAWLGGLRSQIREDIESDDRKNDSLREILENNKLYCRYACCTVRDDIQDTLWYLSQLYFGEKNPTHPSGRYKKICVKEFAPDNVHWV